MGDSEASVRRQFGLFAVILAVVIAVVAAVVVGVAVLHHPHGPNHERDFALPFTGLADPRGVAVDGAGDVYVADSGTNRVLEMAAGSNAQTVLPFTGLKLSTGVVNYSIAALAVDGAGNLYVADSGNNRVLKLAPGSSAQTVLPFAGLGGPSGVALDTAGDVYVSDPGLDTGHGGRVVELAAGASTQTVLPPTGRHVPDSVAVDTAGNVYTAVFDSNGRSITNYLIKLAVGADKWTPLPSAGAERYVTTDTVGNVYVMTAGEDGGVRKLAAGSHSWTELTAVQNFRAPGGLAVDARGNAYVSDNLTPGRGANGHGLVVKLPAAAT
jgi:sugar lactone lactonase YvrE